MEARMARYTGTDKRFVGRRFVIHGLGFGSDEVLAEAICIAEADDGSLREFLVGQFQFEIRHPLFEGETAPAKPRPVKKAEVQEIATRIHRALMPAEVFTSAEKDAKWAIGVPGFRPDRFFTSLDEAYDYCAEIISGGQEVE